jgi:hypothetical protein
MFAEFWRRAEEEFEKFRLWVIDSKAKRDEIAERVAKTRDEATTEKEDQFSIFSQPAPLRDSAPTSPLPATSEPGAAALEKYTFSETPGVTVPETQPVTQPPESTETSERSILQQFEVSQPTPAKAPVAEETTAKPAEFQDAADLLAAASKFQFSQPAPIETPKETKPPAEPKAEESVFEDFTFEGKAPVAASVVERAFTDLGEDTSVPRSTRVKVPPEMEGMEMPEPPRGTKLAPPRTDRLSLADELRQQESRPTGEATPLTAEHVEAIMRMVDKGVASLETIQRQQEMMIAALESIVQQLPSVGGVVP